MIKKPLIFIVSFITVASITFLPMGNIPFSPITFADSINLIQNSQLAPDPANSAVPQGWFFGKNGTNDAVATYPVTGPDASTTAAQVTITSSTDGFGDWFVQPVPATANAQYHFSDAYLSDAPTIIEAQYEIMGTSTLTFEDVATLPATNGSWATANATFTAPAGATSITVFHLLNTVGSLSFSGPSLTEIPPAPAPKTFSQGMVSLTFDDGTQTQYDAAAPILKAAGLPATFYIISKSMLNAAKIGTSTHDINNSYMDGDEVLTLNAAGNEIGSHTANHCDLVSGLCPDGSPANTPDSLSLSQEIDHASTTLHAIGTVPVDTFAYPYGSNNQATQDALKQQGFISARTVNRGFNLPNSNPYTLQIQYINASTVSDADFQSVVKPWIDSAVANHTWLILLFHQIEPTSTITITADPDATTPEMVQNVANYLKNNNIMVKTVHDATCMMDGMASDPRCVPVQYPSAPVPTPTPTSTPGNGSSTGGFPPSTLATLVVANNPDGSLNVSLANRATLTLQQNGPSEIVQNPTFGTTTSLIPDQQYHLTANLPGHTVTYLGDCAGTAKAGKAYSCVMIIDDQD